MSRHRHQPVQPKRGCAIYLRTSSEEAQNPENSQRRQRHTIEHSFLSREPMPVLGEYIDNLSGRSSHNRPDYQRMLADARAGLFSHVVVENAERFGRNDTEALTAIDELHELGVAVRFADYPDLDPIDPDDRIMVSLSFTLARRESIKLGQRVRGGLHAKLRNGGCSGLAPDGYINCEERVEMDKSLHGRYRRWVEVDESRAMIWRTAWELLLTERYTLAQICEQFHALGYHYRTGRPFVTLDAQGRHFANINTLAKGFHNWFYAGWVVSEKAGIAPKTIRGLWTPLVSTEDFERGLSILAKRAEKTLRQRKHEYLLSGMIFLQLSHAKTLTRLICSTSNPSRPGGGTSHYRVTGTTHNFLCTEVEDQLASYIANTRIEPDLLPLVKAQYTEEVAQKLGHRSPSEKQKVEVALKAIDAEEARTLRLFAAGMVSEDNWRGLWAEWQDRRNTLKRALIVQESDTTATIAGLEDALHIISKIDVHYERLNFSNRKALLRALVERVVVDATGNVIRIDLHAPFAYLNDLKNKVQAEQAGERKIASDITGDSSIRLSACGPEGLHDVN